MNVTFLFRSTLPLLSVLLFVKVVNGENKTSPDLDTELLEWQLPKSLTSDVHYYLSGYDYDDKPVLVLEWGHWKYVPIAEKGGEGLKNLNKLWDQLLERVTTGYFEKKTNSSDVNSNNEVVFIWDFDGLQLSQISSKEFVKFGLHRVARFDKINEFVAYGFIVNANPIAHQFLRLARPNFEKYLAKMEIFGTNSRLWIPQILRQIPRSELSPAYGGTKDYKPISIYG